MLLLQSLRYWGEQFESLESQHISAFLKTEKWVFLVSCTYPDSNLVVTILSQLYQVEAIVQQVFYAAMEVLTGGVWLLRVKAMDSS